jgi:putative transposase
MMSNKGSKVGTPRNTCRTSTRRVRSSSSPTASLTRCLPPVGASGEAFLHLEDKLEKQRKIEAYIDRGYGDCALRKPQLAEIIQENWWHHDGVKYRLLAWCIMPNHLHVLVELWQTPLGEILQSWKSYTSKQANRVLGRSGTFWEEDYFDHYIRDEKHFWQVVHYIENNPVKAHLVRTPEDWTWSSARYRSKEDRSARTLTHPTASCQAPPPT